MNGQMWSGDSEYSAAASHLPENTGDKEMEVIVIELKSKTAKPATAEPSKK
jgi:hypothetical protein